MANALPPGTLIPNVRWPGVTAGVQSFQYTVSHGITPSVALIVTNPQPKPPAGFGKLAWSDGRMGMALSDCKLQNMQSSFGPGGFTYTFQILDRRWQWSNGTFKNGGGRYNQLDPNGKLIPWTIRSPTELAAICLKAMGETRFRIEGLPPGLSSRQARRVTRYLETGENYPVTATNPPTNWEGLTPAGALAELCERYGCRVIFQPGQDRLLIQKLGTGRSLPEGGSLAQASASMDAPETPVAVGVYGAPSQYQARFALQPVAKEWDGTNHYVPINDASYAPQRDSGQKQRQVTICTVLPSSDAATATLRMQFIDGPYQAVGITALLNRIQNSLILRDRGISASFTSPNIITLTGSDKEPFSVQCSLVSGGSGPRSRFDARLSQPYKSVTLTDWSRCAPPGFWGVQATDRLSVVEARNLAQSSVWRCYRIMDEDAELAHENARERREGFARALKPINIPGYGKIKDRRQIVPSALMVDQVVPSPRTQGGVALNQQELTNSGVLPEYYNGMARNRSARVYGQYARTIGSVLWNSQSNLNTDPMALVKVSFTVDPINQLVIFSEPVYRYADTGGTSVYCDPELVLECACTVRDPETWSERRPTFFLPLPGGIAPAEWLMKEDVVANYIGEYGEANNLKSVKRPPEDADGPRRAKAYMTSMAAKYQLKASEVRTWNGVKKVDPDGIVQQVGWRIDQGGIYTTASTNNEFSAVTPSYPARRNRENLAADPNAVLANARDQSPIGAAEQMLGGAVAFSRKMGGAA
jgi:hypothetical protein